MAGFFGADIKRYELAGAEEIVIHAKLCSVSKRDQRPSIYAIDLTMTVWPFETYGAREKYCATLATAWSSKCTPMPYPAPPPEPKRRVASEQ